jgi:hypothetical protein
LIAQAVNEFETEIIEEVAQIKEVVRNFRAPDMAEQE